MPFTAVNPCLAWGSGVLIGGGALSAAGAVAGTALEDRDGLFRAVQAAFAASRVLYIKLRMHIPVSVSAAS